MSALSWKQLSEIEARPIVFADRPIWQQSAFHLLVGRKNSGKGTLLAAERLGLLVASSASTAHVLWVATGEDSYAIDVRPRIEVAGGDISRVTVLNQGRLVLPDHVNDLLHKAREVGDAAWSCSTRSAAAWAAGGTRTTTRMCGRHSHASTTSPTGSAVSWSASGISRTRRSAAER